MNEMPSSRFRVAFHKLDEPTVVTANGHAIGTWLPGRPSVAALQRALDEHNATAGAPIIGGMASGRGIPVETMAELMTAERDDRSVNSLVRRIVRSYLAEHAIGPNGLSARTSRDLEQMAAGWAPVTETKR